MKQEYQRSKSYPLISSFFLLKKLICFNFRIIDPLNQRVTALEEELLSSQKAFEIYRERARISLKKTAADQKQSDEKILELTEKYRVKLNSFTSYNRFINFFFSLIL